MALSYTIDETLNLVTITGDYADAAEWARLLGLLAEDTRRQPHCIVLRDLRAGINPVDAATVVEVMALVRRLWSSDEVRRAAVLMAHDLDEPALVAHALADQENMPIRAFTSYEAALDWLKAP